MGGEEAIGVERYREKRDLNRTDPIHRSSIILDRLRGVERCQALKGRQMQLLSRCLEVSTAKRSLMDQGAIEQLSRRQKLSRWIEVLSTSCRDYD